MRNMLNAAIRSQVTGYLLTRNVSEGSFVKRNQLLFEIDPRPLQAAVDQANGELARAEAQPVSAEANERKAQFDENRCTPLAKQARVKVAAQVEAARGRRSTHLSRNPFQFGADPCNLI